MKAYCIFLLSVLTLGCGASNPSLGQASGDCEGPDMALECFFPASQDEGPAVWLAGETEPGEPMTIKGQMLSKKGVPFQGYRMYFYQTDASGKYTKKGDETGPQKWHGHLHGWVVTDENGRFEVNSIRPAPYPNGGIPAHIHCAVLPPGGAPFYINDFVFADDPQVTKSYLKGLQYQGGNGVVELKKDEYGTLVGERMVVLK